jgi:uncharacterized tellurite resistance protein B-like protein
VSLDPRFLVITDLLLGAVHADDRLEGEEDAAVRKLMKEVVGAAELPIEVEARIENFEPGTFDVSAAAAKFAADPGVKKRKLLELVAAVFDADGEVDFAEDDYMRSLATALGMGEKEYGDLVIEYDVEDVGEIIDVLVSVPPPVPEK